MLELHHFHLLLEVQLFLTFQNTAQHHTPDDKPHSMFDQEPSSLRSS